MKPAPLDYAAPTSLAEAVSLLGDSERDAMVIAGGQSLMPMLNMRLARPELLVDLGRIPDLDYIREDGDWLAIGAMTTKRAVEESALIRDRQPLLHAATRHVGHPQIRNRGTVGGSLAQADPAAEYPAVVVAAGAELRVAGPSGERTIAAADFFVTYLTTALAPGEVLVELRIPALGPGTGWAFAELSRRHGDFAIAGAAITADLDAQGAFADARIVMFGVGPTPLRVEAADAVLRGRMPAAAVYEEAAAAARAAIEDPMSDVHASGAYRRHVAGVLVARALAEAVTRVGTPEEGVT